VIDTKKTKLIEARRRASRGNQNLNRLAVIVPAFNVAEHIVEVISSIPKEIRQVIVVDDACPEESGKKVQRKFKNRVKVIYHSTNQGVGGAMITGYRHVLDETDAEIIVKLDGDGQMDPADIHKLIQPIVLGYADYTKGNRFDSIEDLEQMPRLRIFGNAVLSFFSKVSSGYWNVTDPTNGFTAIRRQTLERISLEKIRKSYFFESDMLFRLALVRAVVQDVAFPARYGEEKSNIKIRKVLAEFPKRYLVNLCKRIIYQYYLREWSPATFELPLGLLSLNFGIVAGTLLWAQNSQFGAFANAGQVMLASLPIIVGTQLLLAFLNYDINNLPRRPGA
jgi:glycosyltransferase involved in cell wall biosynthesis